MVGQRAVHAVAADQDAIMLPQSNGRVVEAGKILKTDGAVERVRQIAAAGDVILGQKLKPAFAEAIDPGVADVDDMAKPARENGGGESAAHAGKPLVVVALRVDPAVGGLQ